jgi:oxygen-independent coproporphyrinogen-3 oxidase
MDLIAGLPGEGLEDLQSSVTQVLATNPENITVHTLALKRGSELLNCAGMAQLPDPVTVQAMVEESSALIRAGGWVPYYLYRQKNSPGNMENVGYTKPGGECIYNIDMIEERRTIIGMGPSAASKAVCPKEWRLDSCHFPKDIPTYIKNIGELTAKRDRLIQALFTG